jgi:hypothetical protein
MSLFSGQGPAFWANRNASGDPIAPFKWFGNAPEFNLGLSTEVLTHKESYSGLRATDARITTELNANVTITVDDFKETNLELATYGEGSTIATTTITDEAVMTSAPEANVLYGVQSLGRVSGFSLKSAGVAVSTSKYTWDASGVFQFSDVSGVTGPITASYVNAASRQVGVFKTAAPEIYTRLYGKNTATSVGSDFERMIVDIFKNRLDPAETIGLISDEFNQLSLNGSALTDPTRAQSDAEGQFARFIYLDPGSAVPSASVSPSLSPSASVSPSHSASPST